MRQYWVKMPSQGNISLFCSSWYREVTTACFENKTARHSLRQRYDEIVNMESQLVCDGALVIKFFLHISRKEQKKRLKALESKKNTRWRVTTDDWEQNDRYEDYLRLYDAMKATGLPVLADDSGLAVDALDGAPGVCSARYAGGHGDSAANNRLLLQNMEGITNRRCRFVCAMALALPGEATRTVRGECEGTLLTEPRGESGFGYDPLFLYHNGKTFAEMTGAAKNKVSHRARAMEQMRAMLAEVL